MAFHSILDVFLPFPMFPRSVHVLLSWQADLSQDDLGGPETTDVKTWKMCRPGSGLPGKTVGDIPLLSKPSLYRLGGVEAVLSFQAQIFLKWVAIEIAGAHNDYINFRRASILESGHLAQ